MQESPTSHTAPDPDSEFSIIFNELLSNLEFAYHRPRGRREIVRVDSEVDTLEFLEVGLLKLRLVSQIPGGKISALSYQACAGDNTKKLTS